MTFERTGGTTGGRRTMALVVEAAPPIDNGSRWGNISEGDVRILVTDGPEPIYTARRFALDEDHWLVPGMDVPVDIDPQRPTEFEIAWDAVPGIEDRVAANDPVLADPRRARRKVTVALEAAGIAAPASGMPLPSDMAAIVAAGQQARSAATPDRFAEALDRAAREPAPRKKVRAVALLSTIAASRVPRDAEGGGGWDVTTTGKHTAVLAVTIPGREPYAVLVRRFHQPRNRADVGDTGLPALVSEKDPNDVEILWRELPSVWGQVARRLGDDLAAQQAQRQAMEQAGMEATERAIAAGPPAWASELGQPGVPGEASKELLAASARQALRFVTDPGMRKMMIEQYRAAGIDVEDDDGS